MREYSFHATDESIEALRRLRAPWLGYIVTEDTLTVQLAEGGAVRLSVESDEVEPQFEAYRLAVAPVDGMAALFAEIAGPTSDFSRGKNDVVVFHGETWIERPAVPLPGTMGSDPTVQFTGRAGQRSASAEAVCMTTDSVVFASPAGTGLLVRIGLKPFTLDVTEDRETIGRFLLERGYQG